MKRMAKFFGIVTVGERGQIVIPKEARKILNIKKGDKLIILSPRIHRRKLDLIPIKEKIGKEKLKKKK